MTGKYVFLKNEPSTCTCPVCYCHRIIYVLVTIEGMPVDNKEFCGL